MLSIINRASTLYTDLAGSEALRYTLVHRLAAETPSRNLNVFFYAATNIKTGSYACPSPRILSRQASLRPDYPLLGLHGHCLLISTLVYAGMAWRRARIKFGRAVQYLVAPDEYLVAAFSSRAQRQIPHSSSLNLCKVKC